MLGRPIAHSLSPVLHRAAYAALGLDWRYDAIECEESGLRRLLSERPDWAGFSCTMPLKRAVVEVADDVGPGAVAAGAGNTLLPRPGGGWRAENTDISAIVTTLRATGVAASSVAVLGAGGTAQAAVVALSELSVAECVVLVRDRGRTAGVRRAADAAGVTVELGDLAPETEALAADLVISTLPPGAADPLARRRWSGSQVVLDVVYEPWPTELAHAASAAGARVVSGAAMLLHQAAAQVELMTGRPAPVEVMRTALASARPNAGL